MIPSALSKAISTDLPSVIVVVGEASLIVERSEQAVVESVLPTIGMPALNHSVFRAAEVSSADLLATLETVPMMSERRLVVLRGIEEGKDELFQGLLEWLATPRPEVVLVVSGSRFPPVRKGGSNWAVRMRNAVKSTGLFLKLGPRDVSPAAVVREHARTLGCEIDGRAVSLLVETVGEDLGRLVQELEKLALFAGDATTLTADMILQSSSRVAEADVWQLTAALVSRDVNAALAALHRALEEGEPEHKLLGLVGWQLRQVLEALDFIRRGERDADIQKRTRLRREALSAVKRMARNNPPSAAEVMRQLATANRLMNSHRAGSRHVLESFVLEVASGR